MLNAPLDRRIVLAILPLAVALLSGSPLSSLCFADDSPDVLGSRHQSEASELVDHAITEGQVAGAVHLVARNGTTIYVHVAGVRDIEDGDPIDADTIVRIYSMTKPITSVAAMTLYERNKYKLDDPISTYIPAFERSMVWDQQKQTAVPPKRPITVRDAFRHTTGYSYDGDDDATLRRRYQEAGLLYRPPLETLPPDMTIEEMASRLASIPAHHHPGEQFTYGYSTDLLGRLIEIWSNKTLDEYIRESVLKPLKMDDTYFVVSADKQHRFASCHTLKAGKLTVLDKSTSSPYRQGFKFLSGGGGLTSTANDFAKFCQFLLDEGRAHGVQVLKPDTVRLMFQDQLDAVPGDFRFGLGFAIGDVDVGSGPSRRQVTQYSWGGYASTEFRVVPELKLYQVFIRQHVPYQSEVAAKVFESILSTDAATSGSAAIE